MSLLFPPAEANLNGNKVKEKKKEEQQKRQTDWRGGE